MSVERDEAGPRVCRSEAEAQREALILGQPARIPPPGEITAEMRALAAAPPGFADEMPGNYAILLHAPELLRLYRPLGTYFLSEGALGPRERELVILRVGWLCGAPYEWGEHVALGRMIGLTTEDIERVTHGAAAPGWSVQDGAILRAVEELFAGAMISDATWEILASTLSAQQLVELPLLVSQYQGLAYFLNSMRVPLRPSNPGLAAR